MPGFYVSIIEFRTQGRQTRFVSLYMPKKQYNSIKDFLIIVMATLHTEILRGVLLYVVKNQTNQIQLL